MLSSAFWRRRRLSPRNGHNLKNRLARARCRRWCRDMCEIPAAGRWRTRPSSYKSRLEARPSPHTPRSHTRILKEHIGLWRFEPAFTRYGRKWADTRAQSAVLGAVRREKRKRLISLSRLRKLLTPETLERRKQKSRHKRPRSLTNLNSRSQA